MLATGWMRHMRIASSMRGLHQVGRARDRTLEAHVSLPRTLGIYHDGIEVSQLLQEPMTLAGGSGTQRSFRQ